MLGGEHAGRDRGGSLFTKYTNVLILSIPQTTTSNPGTRSSASVCFVSERFSYLDGAFGVCVTDGMDVCVGVCLGVAGPAWAHTVLLLTEQSGGLSRPVLRAGRGRRRRLGLGGGLRWAGVKGAEGHARGGQRGVVARKRGGLGQRLAGSAAGGGGGLGQSGAAAGCRWRRRRLSVRPLALCRRRGQRQRSAGPRWRHGGQRDRRVQTSVAALWRLRRAVQPGRQETVLVLSTSDLGRTTHR